MKRFISFGIMQMIPVMLILGQEFVYHSINPFGIQPYNADSTNFTFKYLFSDYDADGDMDLLHVGIDSISEDLGFYYKGLFYFVDYQENTGDAHHPSFADRQPLLNPFPFVEGLFFSTIGDLDKDNRPDLVVAAEIDKIGSQHLLYYHQRANGTFEIKRMDDMGIDPLRPQSVFQPQLTDLDHDGDLDLLMIGYAPEFFDTTGTTSVFTFKYAKNMGTTTNPQFLGWFENPFGLKINNPPSMLTTGDINHDGDVDILALVTEDTLKPFHFYENRPGGNGKPAFQSPARDPFGFSDPGTGVSYIGPTLVDIDGDNDLDLFVFRTEEDGITGLQFFENKLFTTGISPLAYTDQQIRILPNPVRDFMYIENSSGVPVQELRLYDRTGTLVRTIYSQLDKSISVANLPDGVYIVKMRLTNQQEVIRKMMVLRI